jgi:hypothetical protein
MSSCLFESQVQNALYDGPSQCAATLSGAGDRHGPSHRISAWKHIRSSMIAGVSILPNQYETAVIGVSWSGAGVETRATGRCKVAQG